MVCKDCKDFRKKRAFPENTSEQGKICKICDAKFVLQSQLMPMRVELSHMQKQIADNSDLLAEADDELLHRGQ